MDVNKGLTKFCEIYDGVRTRPALAGFFKHLTLRVLSRQALVLQQHLPWVVACFRISCSGPFATSVDTVSDYDKPNPHPDFDLISNPHLPLTSATLSPTLACIVALALALTLILTLTLTLTLTLPLQVTFVDCTKPFRISKAKVDETLMPDLLHPNEQGEQNMILATVFGISQQGKGIMSLLIVTVQSADTCDYLEELRFHQPCSGSRTSGASLDLVYRVCCCCPRS